MGRLNDLPLSIIETILCLIPIQEAGRTSILSREWRYRWTKMPKLVFEENTFQVSALDEAESSVLEQEHVEPNERQMLDTTSKLISAVGQVLLMHDGPIHEFTLSLPKRYVDIDHILTHLSRKTSIMKLELDYAGYSYTSSIFSRTLLHCLSRCPLLKTVILNIRDTDIFRDNDCPTFSELLECLPVIETLSLSFDLINVYVHGRVPQELPTPLFHLKYLSIHDVCFNRREELILALLIKSSPNLEKLKILDNRECSESYEGNSLGFNGYQSCIWFARSPRVRCYRSTMVESSSRVECYAGIMLEHLNELEIIDFLYRETRFDFVKLILARSPVLKKVRINGHWRYPNEKFEISETLSGSVQKKKKKKLSQATHVHHQRYKSLLTALSTDCEF